MATCAGALGRLPASFVCATFIVASKSPSTACAHASWVKGFERMPMSAGFINHMLVLQETNHGLHPGTNELTGLCKLGRPLKKGASLKWWPNSAPPGSC